MTEDRVLSIPRINCGGCVKNVRNALQTLPGVEIMETDVSTKMVHLRYIPQQTPWETIKKTLADAKYPVADNASVSSREEV